MNRIETMSEPSETQPEPKSTTSEKPPIRKAQEEFIGDEARPSKDRSEVAEEEAK